MTLTVLRVNTHSQFLKLQQMYRIIHSVEFEKAFDLATEEQKNIVEILVKNFDKIGLKNWIQNIIVGDDYNKLPMMQLRELAKKIGVKYYMQRSRKELIFSLRNSV